MEWREERTTSKETRREEQRRESARVKGGSGGPNTKPGTERTASGLLPEDAPPYLGGKPDAALQEKYIRPLLRWKRKTAQEWIQATYPINLKSRRKNSLAFIIRYTPSNSWWEAIRNWAGEVGLAMS